MLTLIGTGALLGFLTWAWYKVPAKPKVVDYNPILPYIDNKVVEENDQLKKSEN